MMADAATATRVAVDWTTGEQSTLTREDAIVGCHNGGPPCPVEIEQVPTVLSDPDGWIQWASKASLPDEWSEGDTFDTPCLSRVYARGVVHVMLVWEDG